MKSGTEDKLKFKRLQRALKLSRWQARGLLDTLWKFAADNAPAGDVGRFSDEEIAIGIDWNEDQSPEQLISILLDTNWLDRTPDAQGRLFVHDWPEHCEDRVHKHLARRGEIFADGTLPSLSRLTKDERKKALNTYTKKYDKEAVKNGRVSECFLRTPKDALADARRTPQPEPEPVPLPVPEPIPEPEPSHTSTVTSTKPLIRARNGQSARNGVENSRRVSADPAADRTDPADQREISVGEALEEAAEIAKSLFRKLKFKGRDGKYLWQVAIAVLKGKLPESVAFSAANGVNVAQESKRVPSPVGYFRTTLEGTCRERGIDVKRILGLIKLPDGHNYGPPRTAENPMAAILREAGTSTT